MPRTKKVPTGATSASISVTKRVPVSVQNLQYFVSKIRPLDEELSQIETRKDEIEEELFPFKRSAEELAREAFDDLAARAAREWKATNDSDENEPTLEWADVRFKKLPAEVVEFANDSGSARYRGKDHQAWDLMRFYQSILNLLEEEPEDDATS